MAPATPKNNHQDGGLSSGLSTFPGRFNSTPFVVGVTKQDRLASTLQSMAPSGNN
ncbi:MAG: hypothetical protein Q7T96_01685 [Methylobacter sp.]|nr:hypothetical protein [Methylobacter sp.]